MALASEITPEMDRLWLGAKGFIPGVKLGGIYANKAHYHNTVLANKRLWPSSYSIKLPLDLPKNNRNYNKARALDLTMSTYEMIRWTTRMMTSALDPRDNRLAAVREFYGTLDGYNVYGLIKDDLDGPWRKSSADKTHLWHGHKAIFTSFVDDWDMLSPQLSVEAGQSWEEYKMGDFLPIRGNSGENVSYWQYVYTNVRGMVNPVPPEIKIDGDYGPVTASAFSALYRSLGGKVEYNGSYLSAWVALRMHQLLAKREAQMLPKPPMPAVDSEVVKQAVRDWLFTNLPDLLTVEGNFKGKVILDDEPA